MGVGTAILVWPKALDWLISASGTGVAPLFTPSGYVHIYVLICLVFGAVFLYPIIVVFLMISGVVPTTKWRKWRRPAIVILCAVAAVVTPSNDPFSFLALADADGVVLRNLDHHWQAVEEIIRRAAHPAARHRTARHPTAWRPAPPLADQPPRPDLHPRSLAPASTRVPGAKRRQSWKSWR